MKRKPPYKWVYPSGLRYKKGPRSPLRVDGKPNRSVTHGLSKKHPLHGRWNGMIQRCTNPKRNNYHIYGARGIKVCKRWRIFKNFFDDMSPTWKPGLFIERINNDGDYEPSNCKWATKKEQLRNTRCNRFIEHNGLRLTLAEWAERLGLPNSRIIRVRLFRGWSDVDAITTPILPVNSGWTNEQRHLKQKR